MTDFDQKLQLLRQRFVVQALADADRIEESAAVMEWRAVRDLSHGISGRAGMFGFQALSEAAGRLERAIDDRDAPERLAEFANILVSDLRHIGRDTIGTT